MKYPRKVKVSHKTFTLVEDKGLAGIIEACGICGPDTQDIRIDADLGPDTERETVLHELLHAFWNLTALDKLYTDEQEEQVVYTLSPGIMSILQDNPELVRYLLRRDRDYDESRNSEG